jgi:uncharacterized ferredoxin-like protein
LYNEFIIQLMQSVNEIETVNAIEVVDEVAVSIEEHKQIWVECEEKKIEPRLVLKDIAKTQRSATKAIREYMNENHITNMNCGNDWFITCEEVQKVSYSEDICGPYMTQIELERLKRDNTTLRNAFKTLPPPKRQCL